MLAESLGWDNLTIDDLGLMGRALIEYLVMRLHEIETK